MPVPPLVPVDNGPQVYRAMPHLTIFKSLTLARNDSSLILILIWTVLIQLAGCSGNINPPALKPTLEEDKGEVLRLATTTSTRDSGLLDELLPVFEKAQGCRVDVIAVGTGAALKLGEAGDVDLVLVHARQAEQAFMKAKHGVRHEEFMYNHFVLLGPPGDPAQIRSLDTIDAMTRIADENHRFISRGDNSGTHMRELSLWKKAQITPGWENYLAVGQGMGATLLVADEKQGYVLADMGTYLKFQAKIDLVPLANAAGSLRNPYSAIVVNPAKHEPINSRLANAVVDFLIADEAQRVIANYQVRGQQLFYPTRLNGNH